MNDKYILGLDLGTNSIGAAIVGCDDFGKPQKLLGLFTRIFQEMTEDKTEVPKNKKRREARSARKLNARYKKRRTELVNILVENGFLPNATLEGCNWERIFNKIGEPFALRAKALDESLEPHEFGRVLMHLLRRRGYRSNRGAKYIDLMKHPKVIALNAQELEDTDEECEDDTKRNEHKKVLAGINRLTEEMNGRNCRTLGEFIYKASSERSHEPRRITKLTCVVEKKRKNDDPKQIEISLYAERKMYEDEFDEIWKGQKDYLDLTDGLKADIYETIFFQRPLKLQKNLVGRCSFEMKKPRAMWAVLEAQEFRMLQEINDLKLRLPKESQFNPLTAQSNDRHCLLDALKDPANLNDMARLTWTQVKKILDLPEKGTKFNLQETAKQGISGNRTELNLSKTIPERWNRFDEKTKGRLIDDLLTIHDKKALFSRLINEPWREGNQWSFTPKEAYDLATLELEPGYAKHCLKVIRKILPEMRVGLNYHDACQKVGYLRKDQKKIVGCERLPLPPNVANPVVQKALYEVRRVVNAILQTYGRPELMRVELARDLKASKKHRKDIQDRQKENGRINDEARKELRAIKIAETNSNIEKYKLWNELNGIAKCCPYCDDLNPILVAAIFSDEVEVDHIIPLSLSRDDSYMNKLLCHRSCNQDKGQRLPYEAWGDTQRFDAISQRLKTLEKYETKKSEHRLSPVKIERIRMTEFDADGFTQAQLNDAKYISVAVKNYLEQLGISIQVTTGMATSQIRKQLGLHNILPNPLEDKTNAAKGDEEDDDSNEAENKKGASKAKKSRLDQRHHAIDALVTALTDKGLFDEISKRYKQLERTGKWPSAKLEKLWSWDSLRSDVKETVMRSVVSYAASRKIHGALHEEMPFGASHYIQEVDPRKLTDEIINAEPDSLDAEGWIAHEEDRSTMRKWLKDGGAVKKRKNAALPVRGDGALLERIKVAHRCFVKRIAVQKALKYTGNEPGEKTWIVSQNVRSVLKEWTAKGNKATMAKESPPVIRDPRANNREYPIKAVRVAKTFSPSSIKPIGRNKTKFFALGSNHHAVIFRHKATGKTDGKVISMLEAASRKKSPPVFSKQHPDFIPSKWEFKMFLCQNDMVEWNINDPKWKEAGHEMLGKPVYRVEQIEQSGRVVFLHFSISATSKEGRGVIRCSFSTMIFKGESIDKTTGEYKQDEQSTLRFRKIDITPLGDYTAQNER